MGNNSSQDEASEIRKRRVNKELIECFKKTPPTTTVSPSDQGIGFYTHVRSSASPRLLPVGGWNGRKFQPKSDRNVHEEVKQVYEELTKAVQDEQKAPVGASMAELQRRYADVGTNGKAEPQLLSGQEQQYGGWESQGLARNKPPTSRSNTDPGYTPTLESTRTIGLIAESQKAPTNFMGVNDDQRRKSVTGGNIYDADRDPRRRGK